MADLTKYYSILGIKSGASIEEIKKAYRLCARKYHPDLNKESASQDMFIAATEAYDLLLSHYERQNNLEKHREEHYEKWLKYRQEQARKRAYAYARVKYKSFTKSNTYKSTRALEFTPLVISFALSIMIITFAVYGYARRLQMANGGYDKPSLIGFILLLFIGTVFLASSVVFTSLFYKQKKSRINNEKKNS